MIVDFSIRKNYDTIIRDKAVYKIDNPDEFKVNDTKTKEFLSSGKKIIYPKNFY